MKLFLKILLFVLVSLATDLNVVSEAITFSNTLETIAYSSFHFGIAKTIEKVFDNDLPNCYQNEKDLINYRD